MDILVENPFDNGHRFWMTILDPDTLENVLDSDIKMVGKVRSLVEELC